MTQIEFLQYDNMITVRAINMKTILNTEITILNDNDI